MCVLGLRRPLSSFSEAKCAISDICSPSPSVMYTKAVVSALLTQPLYLRAGLFFSLFLSQLLRRGVVIFFCL